MNRNINLTHPPHTVWQGSNLTISVSILKCFLALAGVAQWIEHWPENQKVTGLIPSQGTRLGYGPGLRLGPCERQPFDVYLSFSFPFPLSKNK